MTEQKTKTASFITSDFILSYPKLLKAEPYMEKGKPKGEPQYGFEAISELDSLDGWYEEDKETGKYEQVNVEKRLVALAKELWGNDFNAVAAVRNKELSWPFKSGDRKVDEKGDKASHYKGRKFWRAKALAQINGSANQPNLFFIGSDGKPIRIDRNAPSSEQKINQMFYGGAICKAEVNAVAGQTAQGKYVTLYVNSVVFKQDGERLGNGSGIERFYGTKGGSTNYDPTDGMSGDLDDEIPF